MNNIEILEKERNIYIKKQFSRNPYYLLLRVFGANWWWSINELNNQIKEQGK